MCGIAGIYGFSDKTRAGETLNRMAKRMEHRGPDAEGIFVKEGIALAHQRLSIIDLSHQADQPMTDASGRFTIVFNGEIYNYRELRKMLREYPFRTQSDTEVLLAGLATYGIPFVKECNGMFAFGLWDAEDEKLYLCRDRLGIKPLYYLRQNEEIFFGSEIRTLLSGVSTKPRLNREVLAEYLRFQTVHGPSTILEGVFALPPGSFMVVEDNEQEIKYYFRLSESGDSRSSMSYEDTCELVKHRLSEAVRRRLISDVPLGIFLSGGIDSSALVALASSNQTLQTFNISFAEEAYSEARYARMVAERYGTDHHSIQLAPEELIRQLPEAISAMDHPSGDGINTYVVSGAAKEAGITVALSGLGGDELFAGYPIFRRFVDLQNKKWILSFPQFMRDFAGALLEKRNPGASSSKIRSVLNEDRFDLEYIYPYNREVASIEQNAAMLASGGKFENAVFKKVREAVGYGTPGFMLPLLSQVSVAEIQTYLSDILLRDTDQMSMAHALEVRVPFLDHELVSTVLSVPDKFKFPTSPKKLLIDSLGSELPSEIVNRPKMGFTFPWEDWMRKDLKPFCTEMINGLGERDAFHSDRLRERFGEFLSGKPGVSWSRIWHLCILEAWLRENEIS